MGKYTSTLYLKRKHKKLFLLCKQGAQGRPRTSPGAPALGSGHREERGTAGGSAPGTRGSPCNPPAFPAAQLRTSEDALRVGGTSRCRARPPPGVRAARRPCCRPRSRGGPGRRLPPTSGSACGGSCGRETARGTSRDAGPPKGGANLERKWCGQWAVARQKERLLNKR